MTKTTAPVVTSAQDDAPVSISYEARKQYACGFTFGIELHDFTAQDVAARARAIGAISEILIGDNSNEETTGGYALSSNQRYCLLSGVVALAKDIEAVVYYATERARDIAQKAKKGDANG
jgi:hypothetical protein